MNKNELKNQMFDSVLKYVADEKLDSMTEEFPSDEELESKITFDPRFQKRMNSYFNKIKYKDHLLHIRKKSLKAGIIAAACLVICFTVVSNVEALRVPIFNFFNDLSKQSTTIHLQDGDGLYNSFGDQIKGLYLPNYIPELYEAKAINKADKNYNVIFENINGLSINLRAMGEGSSTGVDNENTNAVQIIVNGKQAQYYSKNGENIIIFEFSSYLFMVEGPESKEELIKIAESMEYRK